jgi:hypothetical protein
MRGDLHLISARANPLELLDRNSGAKLLNFDAPIKTGKEQAVQVHWGERVFCRRPRPCHRAACVDAKGYASSNCSCNECRHGASQASPSASRSPFAKPKGGTVSEPEEAASPRATSSRNGGRDHLGMAGDIKSERWARSFRNSGRHRAESAPIGHTAIFA